MVDANGTFDPTNSDHLSIIEAIDSQELTMFEEPVSRVGQVRGLDAVRLLRKAIPNLKTPICLDDCLTNIDLSTLALDENLADIINIKPGRIGSIMRAIDLAYLCKKKGKQIMVGGMLEATPGRMMTTTLAAYFYTLGFHVPGDLSLAQERLSQDLVTDDQQLKIGPQGGIIIPRSKGWGFEL
jgi:O-succinylbenzoate synthase